MSGVAGLLHLGNEHPAEAGLVRRMTAALSHRGPGEAAWVEGPVGLGHTGAEQCFETGAGLAVTADARLDNHEELLGLLDLPPTTGTAALLLAAYARWAEDCPRRLLGDFALVVWDGRRRRLFCARDPVGARPLFYFHDHRLFACASEIAGLLALPSVPRRLDELRVAQHLLAFPRDTQRTFYRDIRRLPPAHVLTVERGRPRPARYWAPDPSRSIHLHTDADYAEALRHELARAVGARLPSGAAAGAMLSGGLDSSSVVCLARQATPPGLHTFSAVFPDLPPRELARLDERPFIEAVLRPGGLEPHFIRGDQLSPLPDAVREGPLADEPIFSPNFFIHLAAYQAAGALGLRVVLDGLGGDEVVSDGSDWQVSLLRAGHWLQLWASVRGMARRPGSRAGPVGLLWRRVLREQVPPRLLTAWRVLRHGQPWIPRVIRADLVRRTDVHQAEAALHPGPAPTPRHRHAQQMTSGLIGRALELANRAAGLYGVEPCFPFLDRQLMELCLAIPPEQHQRQGWDRSLIRRAMEGTLPPEVQWRVGKADLSPNFLRQLLGRERALLEDVVLRDPEVIVPYVDLARLRHCYRLCRERPNRRQGRAPQEVYAAVTLALWLRRAGLAP